MLGFGDVYDGFLGSFGWNAVVLADDIDGRAVGVGFAVVSAAASDRDIDGDEVVGVGAVAGIGRTDPEGGNIHTHIGRER